MRQSKVLKAFSYILLPILIGIIILAMFYIEVKDSNYYNEEKYFESEMFASSYVSRLAYAADRLIYNNSSYRNIKDGDFQIFYTLGDEFEYDSPNLYFLIIYKNKALTNVELTEEINTIIGIRNYIENVKNSKKFNIIFGDIESDSEILAKKTDKYLSEFTNTYYTRDTDDAESSETYIEYITAKVEDFQIYSSYTEEFSENSDQVMATKLIKILAPYENYLYIAIPVCTIITILLVVYLIIAIGYKKGNEGISLNDFDKIPLEIIALIAIVIGCIPFLIVIDMSTDKIGLLSSLTITAYATIYIVCAITLDTIVKRIKSKTFWKTTIIGSILIFMKKQINKIMQKIRYIRGTSEYFHNNVKKIIIYFAIAMIIGFLIFIIFMNTPFLMVILEIILIVILLYHLLKAVADFDRLEQKLKEMYDGNNQNMLDENDFLPEFKNTIKYVNDISNGFENSIQEKMKSERLKAELITNVSHDIKTPLTSIINYVDLLKQEKIENEKAEEYIGILDNKAQRLKKLTEDLIEASKVSTGNISLKLEKINVVELIKQAEGEFKDKFSKRNLEIIIASKENEINIMADSRYMYRIIENLFSNISKYALENSRVYIDINKRQNKVKIEMKNISKDRLNISSEELMQRFVRGDKSRTTEGSGLGISIAQNLTELQKGQFNLILDGDLFKVELIFDII